MQFIDNKRVPARHAEVVILPVKLRIMNNGITNRAGNLTGIRVDAFQHTYIRAELILVLVSNPCAFHFCIPKASLL